MKQLALFLPMGIMIFGLPVFAVAQDSGIPDTFYVEIYPDDQVHYGSPPYFVRFPMYITHDIVDPVDSIAGIIVVLDYWHTNPSKYCSLTSYWNNTNLYPRAGLDRSIFRHYIQGHDTVMHNWMMDLAQKENGSDWDFNFVDLDGYSHFWLSMVPTGSSDQMFAGGSRVLTATMCFKLEDTMTICVDTGFWPIPEGPLDFANMVAAFWSPQHLMPVCESISWSERGDANGDSLINISDVLYMLNYLFRSGPPPVSFVAGDANCDDDLGVLDPLYLLNYLYKGGPPPGC